MHANVPYSALFYTIGLCYDVLFDTFIVAVHQFTHKIQHAFAPETILINIQQTEVYQMTFIPYIVIRKTVLLEG